MNPIRQEANCPSLFWTTIRDGPAGGGMWHGRLGVILTTGGRTCERIPSVWRDGVSPMRFEGFYLRPRNVIRVASFADLPFRPALRSYDRAFDRSVPRGAGCSGGERGPAHFPAQAKPVLNIVREASPQDLTAGFLQAAHAELPESELGLQPQVAEFRHGGPQAISRACRRGLHLGHIRRHAGDILTAHDHSSLLPRLTRRAQGTMPAVGRARLVNL